MIPISHIILGADVLSISVLEMIYVWIYRGFESYRDSIPMLIAFAFLGLSTGLMLQQVDFTYAVGVLAELGFCTVFVYIYSLSLKQFANKIEVKE